MSMTKNEMKRKKIPLMMIMGFCLILVLAFATPVSADIPPGTAPSCNTCPCLLTTTGVSFVYGDVIFWQGAPGYATGTGTFKPFLRLNSNKAVESGINTQVPQGDADHWSHPLRLSDIPIVEYPVGSGNLYREFRLDINQANSDPLLSLDQLKVYKATGDISALDAYNPGLTDSADGSFNQNPAGLVITNLWNLDNPAFVPAGCGAGADEYFLLDYTLGNGQGESDMFALVPLEYNPECGYNPGDTNCNTWMFFYSMFGRTNDYGNNANIEEWAVREVNAKNGVKFNDLNGNGVWEAGEPVLDGWTIFMDDIDHDGQLDTGEPSTVTSSTSPAGTYTFSDFADGTHQFCEQIPAGSDWVQTFPVSGSANTVTHTVNGKTIVCYQETFGSKNLVSSGNNFGNFHPVQPTIATQVHNSLHQDITNAAVPLGTIVHDSATLAGAITPTGTMTFTFYHNAEGTPVCTGIPVTIQNVNVVSATTESPVTAALAAGSYGYIASYSGDIKNLPVTGVCEPFSVNKAQLTITTTIKNAADDQPVSGAQPLGTVVYDTASVTGAVQGFPIPAVSFSWQDPDTTGTCAGTRTAVSTVVGDPMTTVNSAALDAGKYSYQAVVATDNNYIGKTSACEPLEISKKQLDITTTIKNAADDQPVSGAQPLGTVVYDTASVTGAVQGFPIPAVSFSWQDPDTTGTCAGTRTAVSTVVGDPMTTVNSAALDAGKYSYQAVVATDNNYIGKTSACEPLEISKKQLDITTTIKNAADDQPVSGAQPLGTVVYDTADVTGDTDGPIGAVTFQWFTNDACTGTGTPVNTVVGDPMTTVNSAALGAGKYSYQATVASNNNYFGKTSACEPLEISKKQLDITTTIKNAADDQPVSGAVQLWTVVYDTADVTGAVQGFPIPAVSFSWQDPDTTGTCAGTRTAVSTVVGDPMTTVNSAALDAGKYSYQAVVATDNNYIGKTSACEPLEISKKQLDITTTIKNAADDQPVSGAQPLGTVVYDTADVTGDTDGPIGAVTFQWFTNDACTGTGTPVNTVVGDPMTTVNSAALGAGKYSYQATVASNNNYFGKTSACEPLEISKKQLDITTTIKNAADDQPVSGAVQLGTVVYDTADITGAVQGFPIPAVSFSWQDPDTTGTCAGTRTAVNTVVGDPMTTVNSAALGAGKYSYQATVASNNNYFGDTSPCEPLSVDKGTLGFTTTIRDANGADVTGQTVPVGTVVHDTSALTGATPGFVPGGTVTYKFNDGLPDTKDVVGGVPLDSSPITLLADGTYGFTASYSGDSNYEALASESNTEQITVFTPVVGSRTLGFWQTHTALTSAVFTEFFPSGMNIGIAPDKGVITNVLQPGKSQLFGAFYASIPKLTTSINDPKHKKLDDRLTELDSARIRMLQQLVAAKLNAAVFGASPSTLTLISDADAAFAGTDKGLIDTLAGLLDTYNNSGEGVSIPAPFDQGSATPDISQRYADLVFWDTT